MSASNSPNSIELAPHQLLAAAILESVKAAIAKGELPAELSSNAACRNPRSAVSQRAEDAASGRMTPTKPSAEPSSDEEQPVRISANDATSAEIARRRFDISIRYLSKVVN